MPVVKLFRLGAVSALLGTALLLASLMAGPAPAHSRALCK
jgi:hypothetical protein